MFRKRHRPVPCGKPGKQGHSAYRIAETGARATVRIGYVAKEPLPCRSYVHFAATLADSYRTLFPDVLDETGNRIICLSETVQLPGDALCRSVAMALTSHRDKG